MNLEVENYQKVNISCFVGEIFYKIDYDREDNKLEFYSNNGYKYIMFHEQDCREEVFIDDIVGELEFLIDSIIIKSEEAVCKNKNKLGTETCTFYHLATSKGYVTLRWFGSSNGYYCEEVDIFKVKL